MLFGLHFFMMAGTTFLFFLAAMGVLDASFFFLLDVSHDLPPATAVTQTPLLKQSGQKTASDKNRDFQGDNNK